MKNKLLFTILLISINCIFSQEKVINNNRKEVVTADKKENGKVENGVYECYRFKWKIKIPEKYLIIEEKQLEKLEEKGNEQIKKNLPENIKIQNRKHLIGFQLNNQNTFSASFNPLDKTKKINLEEHEILLTELLKKSYSKIENAKFEFKSSKIKLGTYQFYKIKVEGFNKENNQLVITQIYYNSFIKEHLFGVLITYNNENDGKLFETNFISSFNK